MTTVRDIVSDALLELRVVAIGDTADADEADLGLRHYNRLFAGWMTEGFTFTYPAVTTWRGAWRSALVYSVGDGVTNNAGKTYACSTGHTSDNDNQPGGSYAGSTYWTPTDYTSLTLNDAFPLKIEFEDPVIALLAMQLSGPFAKEPSPALVLRAASAKDRLASEFLRPKDAIVDSAIIITPARRRPFIGPINGNPTS